jgi:hypothetical protein
MLRGSVASDDQYSAFSNTAQATTGLCAVELLFYLPLVVRH